MSRAATATGRSLAERVAGYDTVALAMQGGGALGAYQAGVFEALAEAGVTPNRLAGISIGALNTAVIAGNAPGERVARLRAFWEAICGPTLGPMMPPLDTGAWPEPWRKGLSQMSALRTVVAGQPGFFRPRLMPPTLPGMHVAPGEVSWYDTAPLKATLEKLVDFDRLNDRRSLRVSVGAVNVASGNFTRFDNRRQRLGPEHFMASGALPPGFPAVEIDGEFYWDGGVVSNTPLNDVLHDRTGHDTLVFQVDLWNARGPLPRNLPQVAERHKEVQYSSRTRMLTTLLRRDQEQRRLLHDLMDKVPPGKRQGSVWQRAQAKASVDLTNVIHLIYSHKAPEGHFKDYEFSLASMRRHWRAGLEDMRQTLAHPGWLDKPPCEQPFVTHDVHRRLADTAE